MPNATHLQEFLDAHLAVVRPLNRKVALASWENALTGSKESASHVSELTAKLLKLYANPEEFEFLRSFSENDFPDPLLARQHNILLRSYHAEQMPTYIIERLVDLYTQVEQEYNNYRAQVRGESLTENEIRKILRSSDDLTLRKEAWERSKKLGERVVEKVLEMVRLRNETARSIGFPDHYVKSLTLDELDVDRVFSLFDQLAKLTDPLWQQWKSGFDIRQAARFGISISDLRPWHYTDQFFQDAPQEDLNLDGYFADKDLSEITSRFYRAIGLPIDVTLALSDLFEKPGKSQHAFCTDIDREGDVRVLCNNKPNEYWMGTMLHEFGHAVYDFYHDPELPYLLRGPAHTLSTEAIAELMGRFSKDGDWLRQYADVNVDEANRIGERTREATRVQFLISTRWILTMCNFERALYRDPEQDLNSLWWDMVERYQHIHRPDERNEPDWAAKLHLALAPVYYQNYLLGEMMAAQLLHHLQTETLAGEHPAALFTSPLVGDWLREKIFLPGATLPWESGLEFATGERLNPNYFASQLG